MSRPKGWGFWLRERGEKAWLKPAGLKKQTGEQSVHFPYLEVDSGWLMVSTNQGPVAQATHQLRLC